MVEIVKSMTAGEFCGWATVAVIVVSGIIEFTPIKINPWSAIARRMGKAMNSEVLAQVNALEKRVDTLNKNVEERAATDARTRILRFGDECLHGEKHSKEHFDQILRDITEYENYCSEHPEFKNNMAVLTIGSIKSIYQKRLADHDFL